MYSDSEDDESSSEGETDDELSEVSTISANEEDVFDDDHEYEDEHIFIEDEAHIQQRNHGQYYIGIQQYIPVRNTLLFVNTISPTVYFRHVYNDILRYLVNYSIIRVKSPKIEIIQLRILPDETYSCVLKTHWLRLIQRHWKMAYMRRNAIIKAWKSPAFQRIREITGKYPYGYNVVPTLRGLLSNYNRHMNPNGTTARVSM